RRKESQADNLRPKGSTVGLVSKSSAGRIHKFTCANSSAARSLVVRRQKTEESNLPNTSKQVSKADVRHPHKQVYRRELIYQEGHRLLWQESMLKQVTGVNFYTSNAVDFCRRNR